MFMIRQAVDEFEPERDFKRLDDMPPRYKAWQELMDTFPERVPEAKEGEHWAEMEKVFDLNW